METHEDDDDSKDDTMQKITLNTAAHSVGSVQNFSSVQSTYKVKNMSTIQSVRRTKQFAPMIVGNWNTNRVVDYSKQKTRQFFY